MTTDTFPFTSEEQDVASAPVEETETGRRLNKRALAVGGGVLAVVVAGGAYLLLSGGGGSSPAALVPHGTSTSTAGASAPAAPPARTKLPVYKGAPAGRDPFKPLVTAPPPAPPPQATSPAPSPTSVPVVGTGTGTGLGGGGGTPTPAPTTQAPQTVLVFRSIGFTSGNVAMVDITYNRKAYRLKAGQTVGGTLKVVSIEPDDSMAVFQVGDQTFDLHVGQAWVG